MNTENIKRLVEINNTFYHENSESFSNTRVKPWNGWIEGLEVLRPLLSKPDVLDFAAGNLRFEKYLIDELGASHIGKVTAVDNCEALLPNDLSEHRGLIEFYELDIIESLMQSDFAKGFEPADLTVSFGFMHHIPSTELRQKFLEQLLEVTKPGGYIFVSFWGFANTDVERAKALQTTMRFQKTHSDVELEFDDYILGWQNNPNAHRYCHNFTSTEIDAIVSSLSDKSELVTKFARDGKTDDLNWYVILKRM